MRVIIILSVICIMQRESDMPKTTQKTSVLIMGLLLIMPGCAEQEPLVESVNAQGKKRYI